MEAEQVLANAELVVIKLQDEKPPDSESPVKSKDLSPETKQKNEIGTQLPVKAEEKP
ncbi:MAG: hypothetical protein ABIU05_24510 [Nitrospirales bacterium]